MTRGVSSRTSPPLLVDEQEPTVPLLEIPIDFLHRLLKPPEPLPPNVRILLAEATLFYQQCFPGEMLNQHLCMLEAELFQLFIKMQIPFDGPKSIQALRTAHAVGRLLVEIISMRLRRPSQRSHYNRELALQSPQIKPITQALKQALLSRP